MDTAILRVKNLILDLLFPKFCVSCRKEGSFLCEDCAKSLIFLAPSCFVCGKRNLSGKTCQSCRKKTHIQRFFAPFSYKDEVIRSAIHLYKYGRVKELGDVFGGFLAGMLEFYEFKPRQNILFVPIPLHKSRKRERGFNQSEILAEFLGQRFHLAVAADALSRIKNTLPQIEMEDDTGRRENIREAFLADRPEAIKNKTIILVDDVSTSGATLEEAARALKKAGARSVWAAVIARR